MAINAYGMPEGYDQAANPGARPRRRPQGGFAQPESVGASAPQNDTAWSTTPTPPKPQVPQEQYQPPQQQAPAPQAPAAPAQPSGSFASRYPSIVEAYRKFLGREPSEQEIAGQTGNGTFAPNDPRINSSIGNIQWSAEAQARTQQQAAAPPPVAPPTPPPATTSAPAGFDQGKWADASHVTPKYLVARSLAGVQAQIRAIPDEAGRKAFVQQHLQTLIPEIEKLGWKVHDVRNEKMLISGGPGNEPAHWADAVTDLDGAAELGWNVNNPAAQAQAQPAPTPVGPSPTTISQDTYRPGVMPQMPGVPRESQGVVPPQPTLQPGQMTYGGQDNDRRTYEPLMALPEWNQPDFGEQEQAQMAALMGVLQNPGIPSQQRAQMMEMQKEQLMAGRDANKAQVQENYLRRGLRGGALGAAERRLDDQFNSDLTRSSRDIEIANAGMRTSDVLNASQGLSSAMGGQFDRANTGFATALNRTLAGEGLRGASADSYRAVYNDDVNSAFNNANFGEQMRQFDLSQQLAMKNFLENQRQYDSGMGFNYAQMQQNYNLALMRSLGLA